MAGRMMCAVLTPDGLWVKSGLWVREVFRDVKQLNKRALLCVYAHGGHQTSCHCMQLKNHEHYYYDGPAQNITLALFQSNRCHNRKLCEVEKGENTLMTNIMVPSAMKHADIFQLLSVKFKNGHVVLANVSLSLDVVKCFLDIL